MTTINIELPFRIISKKNSKQVVTGGNGRRYVISSESFKDFEYLALDYLRYKVLPTIKTLPKPPYKCSYDIYFKGKYTADLDNLIASINDVMEKAGLITNDKEIKEYGQPTRFTNCSSRFSAFITLEGLEGGAKKPDRTALSNPWDYLAPSQGD